MFCFPEKKKREKILSAKKSGRGLLHSAVMSHHSDSRLANVKLSICQSNWFGMRPRDAGSPGLRVSGEPMGWERGALRHVTGRVTRL